MGNVIKGQIRHVAIGDVSNPSESIGKEEEFQETQQDEDREYLHL